LAGKTGTTSDSLDAWFSGFQPTVVAIAWIGFDSPHSLGDKETGGGAALPIWIGYMRTVLADVPEAIYTMPEHMVALNINDNGQLDPSSPRVEYFYEENAPTEQVEGTVVDLNKPADSEKEQLF
jgi:penicillin-binding protein 1A